MGEGLLGWGSDFGVSRDILMRICVSLPLCVFDFSTMRLD